ncbi:MAG: pilus assembly protein TadG-related protein [candidate division KSB1 bacterium]|nr:pilus assembly protein TadG-related protein [candidate division KSB1 bacterium]MDZ7392467.1 pilus assembly protein TadG-related protein [candidate division KSB1 bacterium]
MLQGGKQVCTEALGHRTQGGGGRQVKGLFGDQKGSALALATAMMFVFLCCAGMAIDLGSILSSRTQLQSAVDAAALSGARGLIQNEQRAISYAVATFGANKLQNRSLQLNAGEVSFPAANQVHVSVTRPVNLFFLQLIGLRRVNVSAEATAMCGTVRSTYGLKPWAVPDEHWQVGDRVVLKTSPHGHGGTQGSWHYPICFPPLNRGNPVRGADAYRNNLIYGASCKVEIGDWLLVEPGNMQGPTSQGVNEILALDPGAYWDGDHIAGSRYPGDSSPRVCKIALIDPNDDPGNGRTEVRVIRFGVFFLEGMDGQDVVGYYMRAATRGEMGPGGSDLFAVKLVS